ncbi:HTH-type transcriptional regulator CysB [Anaerotignum neopropionicum]|uniref:HTH-type transcriptional regulator CysB n=1 Tax=Anaerotignum neopropionicum TaxID=36847 RepID=A0A136WBH5_9FIRM|nr:LysR family transcriptional regulator [Anaerotignum neopropionicum]KXL51873.1 HTH-type transcriptional regulator CysB [Anaerotignum neopropionicum]
MTLMQLEYIMEIYHCGSMNKAAQNLFVSQSAISTAIKELEEELGITIFIRSNRGISLTEEGQEFISKIHPLLQQAKDVELFYSAKNGYNNSHLYISTQRYPFCAKAFVEFLKTQSDPIFHYGFKECPMGKVIEEVHTGKSDLGIIFLSDITELFLSRLFHTKNLIFHEMKRLRPHVFMNLDHPLAQKKEISFDELKKYPFVIFSKKEESSFNFSEEAVLNHSIEYNQIIYVNDRATAYNILAHTTAISTGSGVLPDGYCDPRILAIPIAPPVCDMCIGWISRKGDSLSDKAKEFVQILEEQIKKY